MFLCLKNNKYLQHTEGHLTPQDYTEKPCREKKKQQKNQPNIQANKKQTHTFTNKKKHKTPKFMLECVLFYVFLFKLFNFSIFTVNKT